MPAGVSHRDYTADPLTYQEYLDFQRDFRERVRTERVRTLEHLARLPLTAPCFNRKLSDLERAWLAKHAEIQAYLER